MIKIFNGSKTWHSFILKKEKKKKSLVFVSVKKMSGWYNYPDIIIKKKSLIKKILKKLKTYYIAWHNLLQSSEVLLKYYWYLKSICLPKSKSETKQKKGNIIYKSK